MSRLARIIAGLALIFVVLAAGPATQPSAQIAQPPGGVVIVWGGGDIPASVVRLITKVGTSHDSAVAVGSAPGAGRWVTVSPDAADAASRVASAGTAWISASAAQDRQVVDQVLIDPGFLHVPTPTPLLRKLEDRPGLVGVGISPRTALVLHGRRISVSGNGPVAICLPASVTRPAQRPVWVENLHPGQEADLVALSRAAIARLGPEFPEKSAITPDIAAGTLLTCGGGDLPDDIWQRFIDLAGGTDAPIVVLPIATPNPDDPAPKGVSELKRLGCKHITVLNQHTHQAVESVEFANALKQAGGVWFVGGRQWHYVDAYAGTVAEGLFRDVLRRGGVIGGSSAGAAIQAEYLVRGDPLGNKDISAEGYEQGLDFLPGTAIDIHVSQRGRFNELAGLIHTYPQLLGIALDEQTAVEVHGSIAAVLGKGSAAFVDADSSKTVRLAAGARYDLAERKTIQKGNSP